VFEVVSWCEGIAYRIPRSKSGELYPVHRAVFENPVRVGVHEVDWADGEAMVAQLMLSQIRKIRDLKDSFERSRVARHRKDNVEVEASFVRDGALDNRLAILTDVFRDIAQSSG